MFENDVRNLLKRRVSRTVDIQKTSINGAGLGNLILSKLRLTEFYMIAVPLQEHKSSSPLSGSDIVDLEAEGCG